jgi:hypothetical protein
MILSGIHCAYGCAGRGLPAGGHAFVKRGNDCEGAGGPNTSAGTKLRRNFKYLLAPDHPGNVDGAAGRAEKSRANRSPSRETVGGPLALENSMRPLVTWQCKPSATHQPSVSCPQRSASVVGVNRRIENTLPVGTTNAVSAMLFYAAMDCINSEVSAFR